MEAMFSAIKKTLAGGGSVVWCRVLSADGSTPRGPGASMAVFPDGSFLGTVGGGAVEYTSLGTAKEMLETGQSRLHAFRLSPNDIQDIGMICGGDVTIFFQCLTKDHLPQVEEILSRLARPDERSWLLTTFTPDGNFTMETVTEGDSALLRRQPVLIKGEPMVFSEPLTVSERAIIFGGGHVGKALVPVLHSIGFRVTVYDDRPHAAQPENFPQAERVILGSYENISEHITVKDSDYAVVMSPGHQGDYVLLCQLLKTDAAYIGCIGSRRKVAVTHKRLLEDGFTEEDFARVHSPIGLAIGAETPEEIAVSIAAEIIAHRANRRAE